MYGGRTGCGESGGKELMRASAAPFELCWGQASTMNGIAGQGTRAGVVQNIPGHVMDYRKARECAVAIGGAGR